MDMSVNVLTATMVDPAIAKYAKCHLKGTRGSRWNREQKLVQWHD